MPLNRKSQWMVDNVYQGFSRINPMDTIEKIEEGANTQGVRWIKNGHTYRTYKFHADSLGVISSMTVHGADVLSEYYAMSKSMVAFGLPIRSINTNQGEDGLYVNVLFDEY